jgi:predicted MPP superfamily phosphohydrolase
MRIIVVQISDLHFRSSRDGIVSRAKAVVHAILAVVPTPDACYIALTGDIANSGDKPEYEVAKIFIVRIKEELLKANVNECQIISIPGNHDLNLRKENATRRFLLENLDKYLSSDIDFESSTFESMISVQDDFNHFLSEISDQPILKHSEKLYFRRTFSLNSRKIMFHCFNTSWLSRRNEQQAKLYLPPQIYNFDTPPEIDVSIAMFHHPYTWLEANNQKMLQKFVNQQADVVLTGHEHDADVVRMEAIAGETVDYLMAPAFDDPNITDNGFQMLTIDFEDQQQTATMFSWETSRFVIQKSKVWNLQRNSQRASDPLSLRPEFFRLLGDMGATFRHPRCNEPNCQLRLRDLYVYPDLKHREIERILKRPKADKAPIQGRAFAKFLLSKSKVLLFGADDCGKTSFAKVIFEDLKSQGDFPLLVDGETLKRVSNDATLVEILSKAICNEYTTASADLYWQLDSSRKVLIIDDFDKAKLSKEGQHKLVTCIKARFHRILIIASDYLEIQDMLANAETDPFFGFERCTIKEFGHYHRQKLIELWVTFGRDSVEQHNESINALVMKIDKTISTLMGKNTLPHHPVTILSLLQLLDSKDTVSASSGAYGYLYEMLLKQALATVNARDVDEKITYLSGIGYAMFNKRQALLSEEEMRAEHDAYCERYDMVRDFSKMMEDLSKASVLVESNGVYRFKYPYEFYYSTAKYFQNHAGALRRELYAMSDHLYGERNANVLIVYVYLTKDDDLIRHIIGNAKRIFANHSECDLEEDVEFMNELSSGTPPPLELEYASDAGARRDEYNKRRDQASEQHAVLEEDDNEVSYNDTLQELTKILIAIKTLQVLGQILRNFTASLEGPLKLTITRECYSLGLRTISAVLSYCRQDVQGLRKYIGSLIAERTGITDPKKLASRTEDVIVWMGTASTTSMIKRVSYAVGHSDLTKTYRKVLDEDKGLSVKVIDTAIRLDHFTVVPEIELSDLSAVVRKNNFTYSVIRDLVADYLYFFEHEFSTMQALGAQWNIKVSAPKFLASRSKR